MLKLYSDTYNIRFLDDAYCRCKQNWQWINLSKIDLSSVPKEEKIGIIIFDDLELRNANRTFPSWTYSFINQLIIYDLFPKDIDKIFIAAINYNLLQQSFSNEKATKTYEEFNDFIGATRQNEYSIEIIYDDTNTNDGILKTKDFINVTRTMKNKHGNIKVVSPIYVHALDENQLQMAAESFLNRAIWDNFDFYFHSRNNYFERNFESGRVLKAANCYHRDDVLEALSNLTNDKIHFDIDECDIKDKPKLFDITSTFEIDYHMTAIREAESETIEKAEQLCSILELWKRVDKYNEAPKENEDFREYAEKIGAYQLLEAVLAGVPVDDLIQ